MGQFSQRITNRVMTRKLPIAPPGSSAVAMDNAAQWNKPGGGYEQFIKGDAQREKLTPPGAILPQEPVATPNMTGKDKLKKAMSSQY